MTDLPQPLTPADCNLRDFQFMPMDVARLLASETWVLGTGDERAAAMTLWLESWRQVPAGSVPNDDRMLAHLSQSKTWKKVRAHALRGWIEAADGRLYHPVVAEKVLEAWIEKLAFSISGSSGNAKRWGIEIETTGIRDRVVAACDMLRALAPESRTLKKKSVLIILTGSPPDKKTSPPESPPDAIDASPPESPGDRKGYVRRDTLEGISKPEGDDDSTVPEQAPAPHVASSPDSLDEDLHPGAGRMPMREAPPLADDPAIKLSVALRRQGVNANSIHPAVQDWAAKGVSIAILTEAVALAREVKGNAGIPPNYLVPIVDKLLNPPAPKPGARPTPVECEWEKTSQGIDAMAAKYGVTPRRNEQYRDLARRIKAIIAKGKGPQP